MTHPLDVHVAGMASLGPENEIPLPLDDLIYRVTSAALENAGLSIDDVDGACMAASDLNDGRAISTMTLTGSTGSFGKSELRVCNDSLAAVTVGAAEIGAGAARAIMVCSWSKLSDTQPDVIGPLALEPAMQRALGYHPAAVLALGRSRASGVATLAPPPRARPSDVAAALVLVSSRDRADAAGTSGRIRGAGGSMGAYLSSRGDVLAPLRQAVERACRHAEIEVQDLASVTVAGAHEVPDDQLVDVLGVGSERLHRQNPGDADLGYAAGLRTLVDVLDSEPTGTPRHHLVCSAAGLALENTHAIVMETP